MGAPPLPWSLQTLVEQMASGTATPRLEAVRCGSAPSSMGVGTKVTNERGHGIGGDPPSPPQHVGVLPPLSAFLLGPQLICPFKQGFQSVHRVKGPDGCPGASDTNKAHWRVQCGAGETDTAARCPSGNTDLTPLDRHREIFFLQVCVCWRDHGLSTHPVFGEMPPATRRRAASQKEYQCSEVLRGSQSLPITPQERLLPLSHSVLHHLKKYI